MDELSSIKNTLQTLEMLPLADTEIILNSTQKC